jgi:prevent-host-death family protein
MASVSVKEARQKFAQLVETARCGTPVTITRRGRKVARLTGVAQKKGGLPDLTEFRASLKAGRKGRKTTIEDLRRAERA